MSALLRALGCVGMGASLLALHGAAAAAAAADLPGRDRYPNRSIRLVNPFAPGGLVDTTVRNVLPHVTQAWGQQVVIDNRPGAGTNIGTEIVVRAPPDGYTLLATTGSITTNPNFYPALTFNPMRDLAPVIKLSETSGALAINTGLPAKSLPELIALARAQPGKLTLASAEIGRAHV